MPLQQLVNALTLGGTYSLVALGYALVFGTLGVVNMAHGDVFMFGAFVGYILAEYAGLSLPLALLGAGVGGALAGVLLEYGALRPIRRHFSADQLPTLISTIGFGIVLQNVMLQIYGPQSRSFSTALNADSWRLGSVVVTSIDVLIFAVAVTLMAGLSLLLARTTLGKALRAVAENQEAASLLGINSQQIYLVTVMISSAVGGIAGMLVGIAFAVQPAMGLPYGLKGLAIIVMGGMGSAPGAMVGGFILGLIEVMTVQFLASSWRDVGAFALLFLLLVVRPQGLFGKAYGGGRA